MESIREGMESEGSTTASFVLINHFGIALAMGVVLIFVPALDLATMKALTGIAVLCIDIAGLNLAVEKK